MTEQHSARNLPHLIALAEDVEKRLEGVDVSVVDGVVMISPVAPVHFRTRREIDIQLREQVGDAALGEIEFAHPEWDQKRSPDLIVWHGDEEDPAPYDAEALELAVEIVSPSSVENDYVIKPHAYALAGIPASLVLDPYARTWTLFTDPSPSGYRERASGPYGKTIAIEAGGRTLSVDTAPLPPAKEWQLRGAWPAHRTSAAAH